MPMTAMLMWWVVLPMLLAGAGLAFARLLRAPSLPDRMVALKLMAMAGIGMTAVYAVLSEQPALLDVAMILALVGFLSTVAFATYVERSG